MPYTHALNLVKNWHHIQIVAIFINMLTGGAGWGCGLVVDFVHVKTK